MGENIKAKFYSEPNLNRPEPTEEQKDVARGYVESLGVDPDQVGYSVYVSEKKQHDSRGEVVGTKPEASAVWVKQKAKKDLATLAIEKVQPAHVYPVRTRSKKRTRTSDQTAVILPDVQLGFRQVDGELQPIHDERAMQVAEGLVRHIQPSEIVLNGDNLDLPNMSKHENDPAAVGTLNFSLQALHNWLAKLRASAPDSKITYLTGNHEERLSKYLRKNAPELMGLRKASPEQELGRLALSIEELLAAREIEVDIIESYPAGKYFLNYRLKVIHGKEVESSRKHTTAAKVVDKDPFSSTIFGHIHRIESASRTIEDGMRGVKSVSAHSFGTLARIDGGVPSANWSRGADNAPVKSYENWQHGVGLVEYRKGDYPFSATPIPIHTHDDYLAIFDGREFTPDK